MFFKKSIKFYSECESITDTYPIYPARDYKRQWVKNCAKSFQKFKKLNDNTSNVRTAVMCPGIRGIMESGFIITTWFDFTIETNESDNYNYKVYTPESLDIYLDKVGYTNSRLITDFNTKQLPIRIPTNNYFGSIIKVHLPWSLEIPAKESLTILPVQYDDNPQFTACGGLLKEGFGVELNIHLFWHEKNGRVFVPAGTPLCQIIPSCPIDFSVMDKKAERKRNRQMLKLFNRF